MCMLSQDNKTSIEREYSTDSFDVSMNQTYDSLNLQLDIIENAGESFYITFAKQLAYVFENAAVVAGSDSVFASRILHYGIMEKRRNSLLEKKLSSDPFERHELFKEAEKDCFVWAGADVGHNSPDWRRVLTLGIPGMKQECESKLLNSGLSSEQKDFYNGCIIALDGMKSFCLRLAEKIKINGESANSMSENLKNICKRPPETFSQALQLILITYVSVSSVESTAVRTLGKLDELLLPFYLKDLENGSTEDEIEKTLSCFFYRFACEKIVTNMPVGLSGMTPEGTLNPLSMMILRIQDALKCPDIKFHVHCSPNTPEEFLNKIFDMVRKQNNSFVFCNNPIVEQSLCRIGISREDAEKYVLTGCYEPIVMGKEIGATCSGMINLVKALELSLNQGVDMLSGMEIGEKTHPVSEMKDFSDLIDALKQQLAFGIKLSKDRLIYLESRVYKSVKASPLFSVSMEECVEKGVEAYCGGVKYPNVSIVICGFPSFEDSISIIKELCFDKKILSLEEIRKIMLSNWAGYEDLRERCIANRNKYGNNISEIDSISAEIAHFCSEQINGKPNGYGGVFRMGGFTVDWRFMLGEATAATMDGRFAGLPLSKNLTAMPGQDREGVTAHLLSAAAFDHTEFPDGEVVDVMIHPTAVSGNNGVEIIRSVVKTYFDKGGMSIHINCLDAETLIEAQKHPENYRNLQVRLCGWNVNFVNLSKDEQDFLIVQAGGKVK